MAKIHCKRFSYFRKTMGGIYVSEHMDKYQYIIYYMRVILKVYFLQIIMMFVILSSCFGILRPANLTVAAT